jgi:hypothetical protein
MEKCSGLGACAVRFTDGTINVEATLEGLESQLSALAASEEDSAERIGEAVNAVFDAYKGQVLTMPALVNAALGHLDFTPDTFATESAAVAEYVRQRKDGEFKIAKGKGGGVSRVCDTPPKA